MKVLYISNSTAMSGAPKALLNLATGFVHAGGEAAVVLPDRKGPLFDKLEKAGIKCYSGPEYGLSIWPVCINPIKRKKRLKALEDRSEVIRFVDSVIYDFAPDIVHTNVGPLDIAVESCRNRNIPHVWHLREYQDLDFGMTFYPSRERFEELLHFTGNHNIAITEDIFRHWNLRPSDKVIYDGLPDVSTGKTLLKEKYFLYAARIEKAKGFGTLAVAFRRFHRQRKDFKLVVAGRSCGLYGFFWKCWCRIVMPREAVKFVGAVSDVDKLMNRASALIVPSRCEAFGFSTAEAMQNDCLVIGRNTGGTKEQFDNIVRISGGEGALRFSSTKELLREMKVAISGDDFSEMRDRAARTVAQMYGFNDYISNILSFYNSILQK